MIPIIILHIISSGNFFQYKQGWDFLYYPSHLLKKCKLKYVI